MPLRFKILLLFLFFMLNAISGSVFVRDAMSQPVTWQKWYDYNNLEDEGADVIQTFDGGYAILTNNYQPINYSSTILKINKFGTVEWQKLIYRNNVGGGTLTSYSVSQRKDFGFVISGDYNGDSAILIKTSEAGDIEWIKKYSKSGREARFFDHKNTLDGGIIACGDLYPPFNGYVVKTDSLGNIEWNNIYAPRIFKIVESRDSHYYLLGSTTITKINNKGKFLWSTNLNISTVDVVENFSGFIFVGGGRDSLVLTEIDTSGRILFQKGYYQGVLGCEAMCLTKDGNILLAGIQFVNSATFMAVSKIYPNGNLIFNKLIPSLKVKDDYSFLPRAVNSTSDSGFIFTGFTDYPRTSHESNVYAAKTDSDCNVPLIVKIMASNLNIPKDIVLHQNFPNPFNPKTTIIFELSKPGFVALKILDIKGMEVCSLINNYKISGEHKVLFDANQYSLASGIYFYRLTVNKVSVIKKLILIK